jgi:predicted signal transduction protein with EAL and GGDEF domain
MDIIRLTGAHGDPFTGISITVIIITGIMIIILITAFVTITVITTGTITIGQEDVLIPKM